MGDGGVEGGLAEHEDWPWTGAGVDGSRNKKKTTISISLLVSLMSRLSMEQQASVDRIRSVWYTHRAALHYGRYIGRTVRGKVRAQHMNARVSGANGPILFGGIHTVASFVVCIYAKIVKIGSRALQQVHTFIHLHVNVNACIRCDKNKKYNTEKSKSNKFFVDVALTHILYYFDVFALFCGLFFDKKLYANIKFGLSF